MSGSFPVQPLRGCFSLCVSAEKPQSPADPCPRSSGRITSSWLWGFGGAHGCSCMLCPQCPGLWQPRGTSTAVPALTLAKPIPQHTASSWLKEQEGPRGAPRGFPPHGVPFIHCFADVGFGSCLTCINYRATASSLWQNQLWSSCPESAVPEPQLWFHPCSVQRCPGHLHISCAHVGRVSLPGKD